MCNLVISNYKQFKNLELDLTYPAGHEKEGQPLDKICIIGQSGTGKTNLLEIIKKSAIDFSKQPLNSYLPFPEFKNNSTEDEYITNSLITKNQTEVKTLFTQVESKIDNENINISENEKTYFVGIDKVSAISKKDNDFIVEDMSETDKTLLKGLNKHRQEIEALGISYHGLEKFTQMIKEINENIEKLNAKYMRKETISEILHKLKSGNFIDRTIVNINSENSITWELLKDKIDNYEKEKNNYTKHLFNKLLNEADYSKEESIKDMNKWEEENENILAKIADDINPIIKKFNLRLQMNEHTKSYDGLIIQDLSNNHTIKYDESSTGTKNLLSTLIPLKIYAPQNSMILIDEPEMSFYPDIQRQLTDLYMNVGSNNQLILATHSPLIASSFEPWEVVELKFDKNNQVYRKKYYEGENNHVDNYTLDPRLLTWTGILTDIFDLKEGSNFTFREEALMKYIRLERELKEIKEKNLKREKFEELMKLSDLLGLSGNEKD